MVTKKQQTQQAISGLSTATTGTASGSNLYIGVGNDYMVAQLPNAQATSPFAAPLVGGGTGALVPPRYKTGADASELSRMGPEDIYNLQLGLNQAGLLDSFAPRQADKATRAAFVQLLSEANLRGMTWSDILAQHIQNPVIKTKQTQATPPPLTVNLTNPADIEASFKTVARTLTGGNPSPDEVSRFIDSFHRQEQQAQEAQYAAQYAQPGSGQYYGPGGTTTNAPTGAGMQQEAEGVTRLLHPNEVFANTLNGLLGTLTNALLGGQPSGAGGGGA